MNHAIDKSRRAKDQLGSMNLEIELSRVKYLAKEFIRLFRLSKKDGQHFQEYSISLKCCREIQKYLEESFLLAQEFEKIREIINSINDIFLQYGDLPFFKDVQAIRENLEYNRSNNLTIVNHFSDKTENFNEENAPPCTLEDLYAYARTLLHSAVPDIKSNYVNFGNCIEGRSVLCQLMHVPQLILNLTIDELSKINPFDLDQELLFKLADNKHLYFDISEIFRLKEQNSQAIFNNKIINFNLSLFFKRSEQNIFIGKEIYEEVFNKALKTYGKSETPESFQNTFLDNLQDYTQIVSNCQRYNSKYLFHLEKASLLQASVHWSFIKSISPFMMEKELLWKIDRDYDQILSLGKKILASPDSEKNINLFCDTFTSLAKRLRLAHTAYTAPITKSFGGFHNITQELFQQLLIEDESDNIFSFAKIKSSIDLEEALDIFRQTNQIQRGPTFIQNENINYDQIIRAIESHKDMLQRQSNLREDIRQIYLNKKQARSFKYIKEYLEILREVSQQSIKLCGSAFSSHVIFPKATKYRCPILSPLLPIAVNDIMTTENQNDSCKKNNPTLPLMLKNIYI